MVGVLNVVRLLVEADADINAVTADGRTALHCACENGHDQIVSYLLDRHVDQSIEFKDSGGEMLTAIHVATVRNHENVVRILLEHGLDCNLLTSQGASALHYAASKGYQAMTELLLNHGAKVNVPDREGWTALHWAVEVCSLPIAQILLNHGANVKATGGPDSINARYIATLRGDLEMMRLLLNHEYHSDDPQDIPKVSTTIKFLYHSCGGHHGME